MSQQQTFHRFYRFHAQVGGDDQKVTPGIFVYQTLEVRIGTGRHDAVLAGELVDRGTFDIDRSQQPSIGQEKAVHLVVGILREEDGVAFALQAESDVRIESPDSHLGHAFANGFLERTTNLGRFSG